MRNEIVIACYSENLDWVGDIPGDFDVIICNKGAEITFTPALNLADRIVALAKSGCESDTILRHLLNKTGFRDGLTVFLQGDPFEHSLVADADHDDNREGDDVVITTCIHAGCNRPGVLAHKAGCEHRNFSCVACPWADDTARSKG